MTKSKKIRYQRDAFAVLACKMLGKTVDETAKALAMDADQVRIIYAYIDADRIDFNSNEI